MKEKKYINNSNNQIKKHILTKIPLVQKEATVKDVLSILEKEDNFYDSVDYVYVVDNNQKLVGVFSIRELFNNSENTFIQKFMKTKFVSVSPNTELEKIADIALKNDLKAIPVIHSGKLMGIIHSRKVISIVNKALKEDIFHFAGIHKSHLEFENSMKIPLWKAAKGRLPWLSIGLVGAMFMAMYIGFFEGILSEYIIIASFIPGLVYMSGALVTQVQTIFIRDLAILGKNLNIKKYFAKQMTLALLISLILGVVLFGAISLLWKQNIIALVISLATLISLFVTSFIALLITLIIIKFKYDPALGSGPIGTLISDTVSIIIYFIVVALIL